FQQEIPLGEDVNYEDGYFAENPEASYDVIDYNFDGYKDLSLLQVSGASNQYSNYYLFDLDKGLFVLNQALGEYSPTTVDSVDQELQYHQVGGMAGAIYVAGTIKWKGKEPVVVWQDQQDPDPDHLGEEIFIRTLRAAGNDGQLIVVSKVRMEFGDK